jgi:hypothetical protein
VAEKYLVDSMVCCLQAVLSVTEQINYREVLIAKHMKNTFISNSSKPKNLLAFLSLKELFFCLLKHGGS